MFFFIEKKTPFFFDEKNCFALLLLKIKRNIYMRMKMASTLKIPKPRFFQKPKRSITFRPRVLVDNHRQLDIASDCYVSPEVEKLAQQMERECNIGAMLVERSSAKGGDEIGTFIDQAVEKRVTSATVGLFYTVCMRGAKMVLTEEIHGKWLTSPEKKMCKYTAPRRMETDSTNAQVWQLINAIFRARYARFILSPAAKCAMQHVFFDVFWRMGDKYNDESTIINRYPTKGPYFMNWTGIPESGIEEAAMKTLRKGRVKMQESYATLFRSDRVLFRPVDMEIFSSDDCEKWKQIVMDVYKSMFPDVWFCYNGRLYVSNSEISKHGPDEIQRIFASNRMRRVKVFHPNKVVYKTGYDFADGTPETFHSLWRQVSMYNSFVHLSIDSCMPLISYCVRFYLEIMDRHVIIEVSPINVADVWDMLVLYPLHVFASIPVIATLRYPTSGDCVTDTMARSIWSKVVADYMFPIHAALESDHPSWLGVRIKFLQSLFASLRVYTSSGERVVLHTKKVDE